MNKSHLRLYVKGHKTLLLEAAKKRLVQSDKDLFFPPGSVVKNSRFKVKSRLGFVWPYGIVLWRDLLFNDKTKIRNAFWTVLFPLPWNIKLLGSSGVRRELGQYISEEFSHGSPFRTIDFSETLILGAKGSDEKSRIDYLIANCLELVEKRENGSSILYKDEKDGRLWQWTQNTAEGWIKLTHVNQSQWIYEYVEKLENPGRQDDDEEKEFYESLELDPVKTECAEEGCQEFKVKYSSLCRDHHFEAVRGKFFSLNN